MRFPRWIIPLPAIFLSFFPISAKAEPIQGLNAIGYSVSAIPPIKSDTEYPTCGSETENNINRNFNGEPFQQCGDDLFMIHYTGFIEIPENETISFMIAADDGGTVKIGTTEFGTWDDKGCSWSAQTSDSFVAGVYSLDGWFYENGGGTCYMLAWNIDDTGWAIVPDDAFSVNGVTTSTTSTTSTLLETTTTTTTTSSTTTSSSTTSSTTTLPTSTTTTTEPIQSSTTTSVESTTTTTTTTVPPSPTTTQAPYTPPQTTTSTTEPQSEPTNDEPDESEPENTTTTTILETSTTYPDDSLEEPVEPDETTIPEITFPENEDATLPDESEQPTDTTEPQENTTDTTLLTEEPSLEETVTEFLEESVDTTIVDGEESLTDEEVGVVVEKIKVLNVINDELFEEILDVLVSLTDEQVVVVVEALLEADLTEEQVVDLVSNAKVLDNVTVGQAEQIFEILDEDALTLKQGAEIVEAVQSAPETIRKIFEEKIDVFSGVFDSYVPVGSLIPVSARRTLVVVGALLSVLPVPNLPKFR